jgi:hypothetical protein
VPESHERDDDELVKELHALVSRADPVPAPVADAAYDAFGGER